MTIHELGHETLMEALTGLGFSAADEFGLFVTYERENDPVKLHIGSDGSFAAFDGDDELIAEGQGAQDLHAILVAKTVIAGRGKARASRLAASRRG